MYWRIRILRTYSITFLMIIFLMGCSSPAKKKHKLNCVLHSVLNISNNMNDIQINSSEEVVFNREDAIGSGYEYNFVVYDKGIMIVNGMDTYIQDKNDFYTYSLRLNGNTIDYMQFQFTNSFNDVTFYLRNYGQKYTYDCEKVNVQEI